MLTKDYSGVTTRGNVFVGTPATLKATGCYRLVDIELELKLFDRTLQGDVSALKMPDGFDIHAYL